MIPNALAPIIVIATLGMGYMIVGEASLSYLGLGRGRRLAIVGSMLASGRNMQVAPWVAAFPGAAIIITVLGFNMLGDALRDVLDPRLRGVSREFLRSGRGEQREGWTGWRSTSSSRAS